MNGSIRDIVPARGAQPAAPRAHRKRAGIPTPPRVALILVFVFSCGQTCHAGTGNLTSLQELATMRSYADEGVFTYAGTREALLKEAEREWRWGSVSGTYVTTETGGQKACHPAGKPDQANALKEGAPDAYAKILAYYYSGGYEQGADGGLAEEAREHVLDWVDTSGFHGLDGDDWSGANQCILELSISLPVWIETAILLEGTPAWTQEDQDAFASWLAREAYPKVAWASRVRRNNWGAAGSLAASAIARYTAGWVPKLFEVEPEPRTLDAEPAAREHDSIQRFRIGTYWKGDSRCPRYGIQDHGGIPDELRRGAGGCDATFIPASNDPAREYQTMHVELLVYHAEMLRRAGDGSLFDEMTPEGKPALLQAILFVIDNPSPGGRSWPWGTRMGTLAVANRYYRDPRLLAALEKIPSFRGGRTLPYAMLVPPGEDLTP